MKYILLALLLCGCATGYHTNPYKDFPDDDCMKVKMKITLMRPSDHERIKLKFKYGSAQLTYDYTF